MKSGDLNRKNLSVHLDTYAKLTAYGGIDDSYSDVIDYIIKFAESKGMTKDALTTFKQELRKK